MKNQKGFTLIELVVVMVILGVLAATALPKFMDVGEKSHETAVAATGGAFGTAVAMVKSQFIANGSIAAVTSVQGFGQSDIAANAQGWPEEPQPGGTTLDNAGDCRDLWEALMQNPPKVATSAGTGIKYVASFSGTASTTSATCTFTYQEAANMSIDYQPFNGVVIVDDSAG